MPKAAQNSIMMISTLANPKMVNRMKDAVNRYTIKEEVCVVFVVPS